METMSMTATLSEDEMKFLFKAAQIGLIDVLITIVSFSLKPLFYILCLFYIMSLILNSCSILIINMAKVQKMLTKLAEIQGIAAYAGT